MKDLNKLQHEIEQLRERLHQLVMTKETFSDQEVAQLSAQLDELIVAYEKAKKDQDQRGAILC